MRYQKATGQSELLICSMRLNSLEGFIAKPNFVRGADETKGLVIKRFIPAISNRKSQWVGLLYIYFRHINLPDGSNSNSSKIGRPDLSITCSSLLQIQRLFLRLTPSL